jgi:enoyl-CoA hydratase/carnithine racemase
MTEQSAEPQVVATVADSIMTITLNRPEQGNGWTAEITRLYFALLEQAARSAEVRVIVVTGAGKAFCVGGDGQKLDAASKNDTTMNAARTPYWMPLRVGKPVIAAINGACFGIGLQQALCADIRFASEEAKFSTAYARRGLVAEFGMSWLLPRLVGTGHAMDLLLSARLVRAAEAERMGLVNRVVPAADLMDGTLAYARQLVEHCAPQSMRDIKRQCYEDLMSDLFVSYERSDRMLEDAASKPDFREGVSSWLEKRPPAFGPLPETQAFIDFIPG